MKKFVTFALAVVMTAALPMALAEEPAFYQQLRDFLDTATQEQFTDIANILTDKIHERFPETQATANPNMSAEFGTFAVEYLGAQLADSNGKPCLLISYRWTNNGDSATSFGATALYQAYQNGVQLQPTFISGHETNEWTNVLPGYTVEVQSVHELSNVTDPVVLQVKPFLDFTSSYEPLEITINLQ